MRLHNKKSEKSHLRKWFCNLLLNIGAVVKISSLREWENIKMKISDKAGNGSGI